MKIKIFGTKINITFCFVAMLTLLIITDKSGYILPMILAVMVHEAAHLVTMHLVGCAPKEIVLIPASVRIIRGIAVKSSHETAISLLGPLANFVLFFIFYIAYLLFPYNKLLDFSVINLLIGVFNLLPVKGLDGGIILKKICQCFMSEQKAELMVNICAIILAVLLIFLGVRFLINHNKNFTPIILGIYLILSVAVKL